MQINWNDLQNVYEKSRLVGVSFSLNYEEAADTWYFTISSTAPSESFVGKSRSYETAVVSVLERLESLLTKRAAER